MQHLNDLLAQHGLLLVFGITLLERLGLPVPAAPAVILAGAMSLEGRLSASGVCAVVLAANLLGDGAWFVAGRRFGHRVLRLLCRISLSPDSCVRQSESVIERWGGAALIGAKFLPGVSVVAAPMAGAMAMPLRTFVVYEVLGALAWTGLYFSIGRLFGDEIQRALDSLAGFGRVALSAAAAALAAYLLYRYWRRRSFLRDTSVPRISVEELQQWMRDGRSPLIIDVRSGAGRGIDARRIPGALVAELAEIARWSKELPPDRDLVLYCNCPNEASAASASRRLRELGFHRAVPLAGGLDAWAAAGHAVEGAGLPVPALR